MMFGWFAAFSSFLKATNRSFDVLYFSGLIEARVINFIAYEHKKGPTPNQSVQAPN